jgi:hypothetical protein
VPDFLPVMHSVGLGLFPIQFDAIHFDIPEGETVAVGGHPLLHFVKVCYLVSIGYTDDLLGVELVLVVPEGQSSMGNDASYSLLLLTIGH